jgi:hypothetical protein
MSKSKRDHPTQDEVDQLSSMLREMEENSRRRFREATEFKPGELTPEEEEFVRREGLNALNYIPQKTLQKQSETFQEYEEKMHKRAEVMSRPKTDPERIQIEREELAQKYQKSLDDRFSGFGYGMFLLVVIGLTVLVIDSHGWPMGIITGLLMLAVLELSYRLYARQ